jgi:hypothetical protein
MEQDHIEQDQMEQDKAKRQFDEALASGRASF